MGTGIVSTLFYQIPYPSQSAWLHILSTIFFILNLILFLAFLTMSVVRYAIYPELWGALMRHPKQRLFLGTIPTALSTIINMIVAVCVPVWGEGWVVFAWVLWWGNGVVAVGLCWVLTRMV